METFDLFEPELSSALTSSAGDFPVSQRAPLASDWVEKITVGSGRSIAGLSKNCGPLGSLEKTLLGSSAWSSTTCLPIWRTWATPGGRLIFQLVPSELTTKGGASGLLPTAAASDCKGSVQGETLIARMAHSRGVRLPEELMRRRILPTVTAGNDHSAGRLDEWGGANQFRQTDIGKLHLNPSFVEEFMGFPAGWTAFGVSAMPSSRRSRKSSDAQS